MDITSIIGIVSGFAVIIISILLGSGLGLFINIPSVIIVFGGTIAAAMVGYPLPDFLKLVKALVRIFKFKIEDPQILIDRLIEISNKARKGGLLSIEGDISSINDPYFASALQMTVDGVKTGDIAQVMQKKMAMVQQQNKIGINIFTSLGAYAPAFGMVGTLIGLIQMLANLDDPSSIGPKMAVAMITTFYGAILANLLFLPMADKLKLRSEQEITNMNLLFEGVISIREGEHPRLMEEKLKVYLMNKKNSADAAQAG
ncbi:MAG: MotA/TolQ/ExbB proton channel family protein [Desulforegulaceae bacterium]|nr:MotA/TolQ/ExbB proton channel family protein [Desulforegulaceae bacterium]